VGGAGAIDLNQATRLLHGQTGWRRPDICMGLTRQLYRDLFFRFGAWTSAIGEDGRTLAWQLLQILQLAFAGPSLRHEVRRVKDELVVFIIRVPVN
jgi:hypothetical protein